MPDRPGGNRPGLRSEAAFDLADAGEAVADDTMEAFMQEVREALSNVTSKLDRVITGQTALEEQLKDIDSRVKHNTVEIANVAHTIDFVSNGVKDNEAKIATLDSSVHSCSTDLEAAKVIIRNLQEEVHKLQRYTRGFNIRVTGVPESPDEDCRAKLHDIIKRQFAYEGDIVENAHRTVTRAPASAAAGPRPIIARLHSRATRAMLMRQARAKLQGTNIRFLDDLTATDLAEKRRVQPYMDKLWRDNRRPSFRNGRLYAEGRPVSNDTINSFLSSEEGKAAVREAAERRRQNDATRRHPSEGLRN